jgi:hypothetical protein
MEQAAGSPMIGVPVGVDVEDFTELPRRHSALFYAIP